MNLSRFRKLVAVLVALSTFSISIHSTVAQAAMVPTETLIQEQKTAFDRERLAKLVNQEDAKRAFLTLGVKPEAIQKRIDNMTSEELAQFNAEVEKLPAGGSSAAGVVIFVLLLLIVLDLLGATDIFPAIRPVQIN